MAEFDKRYEWLKNSSKPIFYVLGGTWLMNAHENKYTGVGNLGDTQIAELESHFDYDEKKFAGVLHGSISNAIPINLSPTKFFHWLDPQVTKDLDFEIVPMLSCDSSHRRNSFASVLLFDDLQTALLAPSRKRMKGMGTDTQWLYTAEADPFLFDSNTQGEVTQGAQKPYMVDQSDVHSQFYHLFQTLKINLRGSFLQWNGWLYSGADVVKYDPAELAAGYPRFREVFESPHQTRQSLQLSPYGGKFNQGLSIDSLGVPAGHVIRKIESWETIYDFRRSILPFDVILNDTFNDLDDLRKTMLDPRIRGIVIAGAGLCNVSNLVKIVAAEAAKEGKLVIGVSSCQIGQTEQTYDSVSLIGTDRNILKNSKAKIIDGRVLSIHSARGVLMRALIDGLDQTETQNLVYSYLSHRFPEELWKKDF